MKKLLISICALAAFQSSFAQGVNRSVQPKAGPAPQINIADAKSFVLDNGLKVYVVENSKLPTVSYSLQLNIDVPNVVEKAGLESFIGNMMTSGTKKRSKQQFLDDKEMIGATIGAGANGAYGFSLTKHQDKMLELLSDVVLNPTFNNDELIKLKKQSETSMKMSESNAEAIMSNVSSIVVYGKGHPYSSVTTPASLKNINLSDISKYHRTYFKPNVAYLAVVGDVKVEEVKQLVNKYFGAWQKADVPETDFPAVPTVNGRVVSFANKPGAVQSEIEVSNTIQLKHQDPDLYSARVMNYVLGGGSSSRLFANLREKHAWTYGAYSSIQQDKEVGAISLGAKSRNEVTDSSVTEMLNEMNIIRNQPIDATTLQGAKNYLNGVFALGLRSPSTIAAYAINIDKYNLPKDYYKTYMQKTSAVTIADVQAAAKKFITPDNTNVIIVGNRTEIEKIKKFATNGKIEFYDAFGEPTEAIENKIINGLSATALFDKYIDALGGKAAFENLTSLSASGTAKMRGNSATFEEKIASPDLYYFGVSQKVGGATTEVFAYVLNGNKGNILNMGNSQNMPSPYVKVYQEKANLQAKITPEKLEIVYELENYEDLDGKKVYLVNKYSKGGEVKTKQYYDANTFLLLKEVEEQKETGATTTTTYSDYREIKGGNGLKMPFLIETDRDGNKTDLKYESIKVNGKISNAYFRLK